MRKQGLINRLGWYYPTERFNVFLFGGITAYVLFQYAARDVVLLVYGLLVMTYILYQGQKYWQLKLYRLTGKSVNQARSLAFFRTAKRANVWLCCIMPLVLLVQLYLFGWSVPSTPIFLLALLANSFGVLEHVNYYHRQLMIDNAADWRYLKHYRRLKVASLAKDLAEGQL